MPVVVFGSNVGIAFEYMLLKEDRKKEKTRKKT
jgi:hypothetical protein